ncbi:MAG: hypothetical protein ACP5U1_09825 [Desulfomonilaceae bacterium]
MNRVLKNVFMAGITLMFVEISTLNEVEWFPPEITQNFAAFYMPVASGATLISVTNDLSKSSNLDQEVSKLPGQNLKR